MEWHSPPTTLPDHTKHHFLLLSILDCLGPLLQQVFGVAVHSCAETPPHHHVRHILQAPAFHLVDDTKAQSGIIPSELIIEERRRNVRLFELRLFAVLLHGYVPYGRRCRDLVL